MADKVTDTELTERVAQEEQGPITYDDRAKTLDNYMDREAERRLVWKLDIFLLPILTLAYLSCFIDRASIGNARVLGLGTDLGLVGYQVLSVKSLTLV